MDDTIEVNTSMDDTFDILGNHFCFCLVLSFHQGYKEYRVYTIHVFPTGVHDTYLFVVIILPDTQP